MLRSGGYLTLILRFISHATGAIFATKKVELL